MAIVKVQQITGNGATLTLNGVASGNFLGWQQAWFRGPATGANVGTPTDSNGTFAIAIRPAPINNGTGGANGEQGTAIWYEEGAASGTHTGTPDSGVSHECSFSEFSGLATSGSIDQTKNASTVNSSHTTETTGTTATTAQADELSLIGLSLTAPTGNANVGLTDPVTNYTTFLLVQNDASDIATQHAYRILSATGTQSATFNWTDAENNQSSMGCIATFKGGGGVGQVTGPFQAHGVGQGPMLRRRMMQQFPTPAPVDTVTPAPQIQPVRTRGPGMGPSLRRMFPQTFAVPGAATINAKIGSWTWAGLSSTLVTIIAATVGAWTWSGKTSSLTNIVPAKVGAWTWSGTKASFSTLVPAKVGAWTWAGVQAPQMPLVAAKIGAWTWAGVHAGVSTGGAINATVGSWTWAGVQSPLTPIIPSSIGSWIWAGMNSPLAGQVVPTPPTGSGGGGHYFGYYPERAQELRAEIRAIVKEKKRIERRFKLAPNNADLARLAALLTELQQRFTALTAEYEELIHVWQAEKGKAQEEDEEFLVNLFSESFYND